MTTTPLYRNTLVQTTADFGLNSLESQIISCVNILGTGTAMLATLAFPTGWTTSDIGFKVYKSLSDTDPAVWQVFDGSDKADLIIPACAAGHGFALLPLWFYGVTYFSITKTTASAATTINVGLQPVLQGGA